MSDDDAPQKRRTRMAVRVTHDDGTEFIHPTVKEAIEATGMTRPVLMRMCASGEIGADGKSYSLVDYRKKPRKTYRVTVDLKRSDMEKLDAIAERLELTRSRYVKYVLLTEIANDANSRER